MYDTVQLWNEGWKTYPPNIFKLLLDTCNFSSHFQNKDSSDLEKSCQVVCEKYPGMKYPLEVSILLLMDRAFCEHFIDNCLYL